MNTLNTNFFCPETDNLLAGGMGGCHSESPSHIPIAVKLKIIEFTHSPLVQGAYMILATDEIPSITVFSRAVFLNWRAMAYQSWAAKLTRKKVFISLSYPKKM